MSALTSSRMQIGGAHYAGECYFTKSLFQKILNSFFSNEIQKFHTHVFWMNFRQDLNEAIGHLWPLGLREWTDSLRVNRAPNQFSWPQPSQGSMFVYFLCSSLSIIDKFPLYVCIQFFMLLEFCHFWILY